jgi:hypothetical protein
MSDRRLHVDMKAILESMDSYGDSVRFFLDLQSGEIELWMDQMDEEPAFDPDDPRYAAIPQCDSGDEYQEMEAFVDGLDEADVQRQLRNTLGGKGSFGRFRAVLAGFPDLRVRWETDKQQRLLRQALAWLAGLGVTPQYDLPPVTPVQPAGRAEAAPGRARIGLFDMLLLGAPDGKTELIDGKVRRVFRGVNAEQARKVFARLAAELSEHNGLSWRKRFIEGRNSYEVGGCKASVDGRLVELEIEVPPATWKAFSAP